MMAMIAGVESDTTAMSKINNALAAKAIAATSP